MTMGYEGTSVDDLVRVTGVHRGSLYKTFGSKRELFLASMRQTFTTPEPDGVHPARAIDLALVALLELAPRDAKVREDVFTYVRSLGGDAARMLGSRLMQRAGLVAPGSSSIGDTYEQSDTYRGR